MVIVLLIISSVGKFTNPILQLNDIANKIQKFINELDLTKINELISQWGDQLGTENAEIKEMLENFKDLQ